MSFTNPGPSIQSTTNTQAPSTNLTKHQVLSVNFGTIAAVAAATTSELTFAGLGTGIKPGDVVVSVGKPTAQAGLAIGNCRVDATLSDTFYVTFVNTTAAALTPTASETYTMAIVRPISGSIISSMI